MGCIRFMVNGFLVRKEGRRERGRGAGVGIIRVFDFRKRDIGERE